MKGSWFLHTDDNGSGMTKREQRHSEQENQPNKQLAAAHIRRQARAAREQAAREQRRAKQEQANIERIAKRRQQAEQNRANRGNKRHWWFS